jgi:hypothetical protein
MEKIREENKSMKNKIVGIVILMLVATTVASATNINVKKDIYTVASGGVLPNVPGLNWGVDQKQTWTDNYGMILMPPSSFAQSFTPTKDKLTAVSIAMFKYGTPPEPVHITVSIRDNLTGLDLVNKTIDTSVVTIGNKAKWVLFDFEDITVTPDSTYFIICSGNAGDDTNGYCWLFSNNDTYTNGEAWMKVTNWGTLEHAGYGADFCFKTYFRKPLDSSVSTNDVNIHPIVYGAPLTSMAGTWTEKQKLIPSDGAAGKVFGGPISLDGDTVLIGAVLGDGNAVNSGCAYVFTRSGTTWTQEAKLIASDGALNDQFGCWVSLSGDTALIGSPFDDDKGVDSGSAYVFTRTGTTWTQEAKLLPSDNTAGDWFAYCVSIDGDTALIGAQGDASLVDTGTAYVFTRSGTTWTLEQKLNASDGAAGDCFGFMVSLEGDTALIGADWDDDNGVNSGSAYVFTRSGTTWIQEAKLLASDGAAEDDFSGGGVYLYGNTALIGAEFDDDNGVDSGSAYVFTRSGTTWAQEAKLLPSDGAAYDQFSMNAVTLEGDTAVIGAWYDDDNGANSGSAYIFTRTGTTWTQQQKLLASDGAAGDQFGVAVALDGDTAFIGAWWDDDNGANSGSAYVFTKGGIDIGIDITGGFGVNAVITNHEITNVSDVIWQIHVEGGILGRINKTMNGTIDIPGGGSKTVGTGMLFGFGAISVTVKVADYERTAKGTQLLIFSMVKK